MDQPQSEDQARPQFIQRLLGRKILILLMFLSGILLLLPIIFLVITTLVEREKPSKTIAEKDIFYKNAPYAKGQLIVKYKKSYTLVELLNLKGKLEEQGVMSQKKIFDSDDPNLSNYYLLIFEEKTDIKKAASELSKLSEIEAIGPNYIVNTQEFPNDPEFVNQWNLEKIRMRESWDKTRGSNNVKVAIIDTGIDYRHEDFSGRNIIKGPDYTTCTSYQSTPEGSLKCLAEKPRDLDPADDDSRGHGTHVAGSIGAVTGNGVGIAGVNWNVSLMVIKSMSGDRGEGYVSDVLEGMRFAIDNGANVINLSLSSPFPCNDKHVVGYQEIIDEASSKNIVVVAAAGNNNSDARLFSPASCRGVISVGSLNANDARAPNSNWGTDVDISAPGVEILSTMPGGTYQNKSGTSMAAPHAAGAAALILSVSPHLTPDQVRDCLVNGADPVQTDKSVGNRLNVLNALGLCGGLPKIIQVPSPSPSRSKVTPTTEVSQKGSIIGRVLIDYNNNRAIDPEDPGAPGLTVNLEGGESLITDSSGNLLFTGLLQGIYKVDLIINGNIFATSVVDLPAGTTGMIHFLISTQSLTPAPIIQKPMPIVVSPIIIPRSTSIPSPTPVVTYSCHEKTKNPAKDAIQIGDLECTPNR